jgi:hypothetical protein
MENIEDLSVFRFCLLGENTYKIEKQEGVWKLSLSHKGSFAVLKWPYQICISENKYCEQETNFDIADNFLFSGLRKCFPKDLYYAAQKSGYKPWKLRQVFSFVQGRAFVEKNPNYFFVSLSEIICLVIAYQEKNRLYGDIHIMKDFPKKLKKGLFYALRV